MLIIFSKHIPRFHTRNASFAVLNEDKTVPPVVAVVMSPRSAVDFYFETKDITLFVNRNRILF